MRKLPSTLRNFFSQLNRDSLARRKSPRASRGPLNLEALEARWLLSANASGTISGVVFIDQNNNGVLDPGEVTLPGVVVTLKGATTQGVTVGVGAFTDANGSYSFQNVLPGTYQISAGTVPGLQGGASHFTNTSAPVGEDVVSGIVISGGQTLTQNFGFLGLAADGISMREFLSSTTATSFPDTGAPAGSGVALANSRPNSAPFVKTAISNVSVDVNSSSTAIDLAGNFSDPDFTNSQITLNTSDGPLNVTLFDSQTPQTVANFFDYINAGDYNNAVFTRLVAGFVLQGGGATLQTGSSGSSLTAITPLMTVPNEFSGSNTVGTLAMAQSAGDPNSATDQFFFNIADNSANLDPQKFTVFGQVTGTADQTLLNTLAATPTQNESTSSAAAQLPTVDLQNVPLKNYTGTNFPTDATAANFLSINSITIDNRTESLTYSVVSNSNPGLVSTSLQNEHLSLNYAANQVGTATITVQATDSLGATVRDTFTVTVNPQAPAVTNVTIAPDNATNTTTLTATPTTTDPQGRAVTNTYQWSQNGTAIPGATSQTLNLSTVASINMGDTFAVQVTPNDGLLSGSTFTSGSMTVATTSPITFNPPTVASVNVTPTNPSTNSTLTANATTSDPATFMYQWLHNGTAVSGATLQTLNLTTVTGVAVGDTFAAQVTPNEGPLTGSSQTSSPVTVSS